MPRDPRGARGPAQPGRALVLSVPKIHSFLADTVRPEIARVLKPVPHLTENMLIGQAINAIRNAERNDGSNPILECTPVSIANSVMYAALMGLEIGQPLNRCFLIPYAKKCTWQVGYKGLIVLAGRSGRVHDVSPHVVYEGDEYQLVLGGGPNGSDLFRYEMSKSPEQRGKPKLAFMRLRYNDGGPPYFHQMLKDQIEHIRDTSSKTKDDPDSPWKKHPDEMWKKTVLKQGLKMLDLMPMLQAAISADDEAVFRARQSMVVDVKSWKVVDLPSLPPPEPAGRPEPGRDREEPEDEPAWSRKTLGPLSLDRNFSPADREDVSKKVAYLFQYAPEEGSRLIGKGAGNRAHLDTALSKWTQTKEEFLDLLEEGLKVARVEYRRRKGGEQ